MVKQARGKAGRGNSVRAQPALPGSAVWAHWRNSRAVPGPSSRFPWGLKQTWGWMCQGLSCAGLPGRSRLSGLQPCTRQLPASWLPGWGWELIGTRGWRPGVEVLLSELNWHAGFQFVSFSEQWLGLTSQGPPSSVLGISRCSDTWWQHHTAGAAFHLWRCPANWSCLHTNQTYKTETNQNAGLWEKESC